jgi:hypothetical protein
MSTTTELPKTDKAPTPASKKEQLIALFRHFVAFFWHFYVKHPRIVAAAALAGWTVLTAVVVGGWTVWRWYGDRFDAERTNAISRRIEAQKPFLEKKLNLYFEAVRLGATLAEWGADPTSDQWKDAQKKFWALRWGELELVGDPDLRDAMRRVGAQINEVEYDPTRARHDLRWAVECLADQLRKSLEIAWGTVEQDKQSQPSGCTEGRNVPPRFDSMRQFKAPMNLSSGRDAYEEESLKKKFRSRLGQ